MDSIRKQIIQLCMDIGKDRLLVQGAGGNVSWKDGEILWVKGSGTWLAKADEDDIFVPVDLRGLRDSLTNENFDIKPQVVGKYFLRPSIETVLHALMPQKIVVHLHAVEALSYLVVEGSQDSIDLLIDESGLDAISSAFVEYHKPGANLAKIAYQTIQTKPATNIIFLKNHGIVVGANDIDEIWTLLGYISTIFKLKNMPSQNDPLKNLPSADIELRACYSPYPDIEVQNLALDPRLYKRLDSDWALYPDHVVFLGGAAFAFASWADFASQKTSLMHLPTLIFIENSGVFIRSDFNVSQAAQLRCYYDVISRIDPNTALNPLCKEAINELLNWDAEKHRISLTK
jgi:rhamnose utilization protein RhaD (predicted bifunctional aldolase and dehydrogenase)